MSNPNTLYAQIIAEELAYAGLEHICLAPGSRNTPLVLAFAGRQDLRLYSHLDERSAAFFALGIGIVTQKPAVLVCTSGTAAANFYPAVIEAHQARVPMLVLTADRPHELRESGANQTINQLDIFGKFTLWSVDMALPEAKPAEVVIRNLRATMARAVATATGPQKGVVHLNMPFRKPLEPLSPAEEISLPARERIPQVRYHRKAPTADLGPVYEAAEGYSKGVIICAAPHIRTEDALRGLEALSQFTGYPIIADPLSGMRFGYPKAISSYETFLRGKLPEMPECVIRVGDIPTSKYLGLFLEKSASQRVLHLSPDGVWADDQHRVTDVLQLDLSQLMGLPHPQNKDNSYQKLWESYEQKTWQSLETQLADDSCWFDGAIVYDALSLMPENSTLLMGNSLPVRHLDQFGKASAKRFFVHANRGASGIDGNLSTAFGLGAARRGLPLVAIVGDITFYHDMNGLLAAQRCGIPIIIILINNNGGGIFHRLPVREFEPHFTDYFLTPHHLDFSHAAKLYGLAYEQPSNRADFRRVFASALAASGSTLIEVKTDAQNDFDQLKSIIQEAIK